VLLPYNLINPRLDLDRNAPGTPRLALLFINPNCPYLLLIPYTRDNRIPPSPRLNGTNTKAETPIR
jgi:hypothetical protein